MAWPQPTDYNAAVQNPAVCFSDADLRQGQAVGDLFGLPRPHSGNFADVYQVQGPNNQSWAVKCFTREVHGLHGRYQAISEHLQQFQRSFMVDFRYLEQGIRIRGQWYPILKMRWVEGFRLNEFIAEHLERAQVLDRLAQMWIRLAQELREARMAHGDLQHGNVLLVPGSKPGSLHLRLIDYDGMCVPALAEQPSGEVGHPHYQHPERLRLGTYNAEVDRFAHLVVYSALRVLRLEGKALWDRYDNGENLLFREQDFRAPRASRLLRELWSLSDPDVHNLIGRLILVSQAPIEQAPLLDHLLGDLVGQSLTDQEQDQVRTVLGLTSSQSSAPEPEAGRRKPSGEEPDGLRRPASTAEGVGGIDWLAGHLASAAQGVGWGGTIPPPCPPLPLPIASRSETPAVTAPQAILVELPVRLEEAPEEPPDGGPPRAIPLGPLHPQAIPVALVASVPLPAVKVVEESTSDRLASLAGLEALPGVERNGDLGAGASPPPLPTWSRPTPADRGLPVGKGRPSGGGVGGVPPTPPPLRAIFGGKAGRLLDWVLGQPWLIPVVAGTGALLVLLAVSLLLLRNRKPVAVPPTPTGAILILPGPLAVDAGETMNLPFQVQRNGNDRPLQVHLEGMPPGVTAPPVVLPPHLDASHLPITASILAESARQKVTVSLLEEGRKLDERRGRWSSAKGPCPSCFRLEGSCSVRESPSNCRSRSSARGAATRSPSGWKMTSRLDSGSAPHACRPSLSRSRPRVVRCCWSAIPAVSRWQPGWSSSPCASAGSRWRSGRCF